MTNKELIKQYVDTGVPIPESQYNKLSPNDKKTYIRKRLIASEKSRLQGYEFVELNDEQNKNYIKKSDSRKLFLIIQQHFNKKEIIKNLLEKEYFLNKFNKENSIFIFLSKFFLDKNELFEIILKDKKLFRLLYDKDIAISLIHSNEKDREKIKQLWIDIGFSKQTINNIIKRFNIRTELIG